MSSLINFVYQISEDEYTLLEMQGTITHTAEDKFSNMHLGKLIKNTETSYSLIMGNHQLIGKRIDLKNPIIVAQKSKNTDNQSELKILKIIKSKIVFLNRPTPITNKH